MIDVAEALDLVGREARPLRPRGVRLGELLGLRLAEDVASSVDSPPFDKSVVDGFAIATGDRSPTLRITELVTAGAVPRVVVEPGTTVRVMTGAPVPDGADAVVKWEDCEQIDEQTIRNPGRVARPGSCVLKRGASFHAGQVVLHGGKQLSAIDVALLAEIGVAEPLVRPRPRVGVLATGDELVAAHEAPGPGQIRNSNGPMLLAAVAAVGATAVDLGVARDDPAELCAAIRGGLECDVLLVSGGVSAGVKDLAPGVMAELGVREVFHQVRIKPGKPLWFGVREADGRRVLVFGLPGNPVSTYVSFMLFVAPTLKALAGERFVAVGSSDRKYPITAPLTHRGKRPTYHPCRAALHDGKQESGCVELLDWKGSADIATLAKAQFLAVLPEGDYDLAQGDEVAVIPLLDATLCR
jgi:molybdopterin molybdotransferase